MNTQRKGFWMGVFAALVVCAGLLSAQTVDPSKGVTSPAPDKAIYPMPVGIVPVTGRVLTDVAGAPVANARVSLIPAGTPVPVPMANASGQAVPPVAVSRADSVKSATSAAGPVQTPTDRQKDVVIMPMPPYPYPNPVAVTDAQGNFTIQAVPGRYIVRAEAQGFVGEFFDNVQDQKDAKGLDLQYGATVPALTIKLKSVSTLSGKVTEAGTGKAVASGTVTAVAARIGLKRSAALGADGSYIIEGLDEGRYTVQATARGYLPAAYSNPAAGADSSIVTVRQKTDVTGITLALSKGLSFSGKVTAAGDGPLAGAIVTATRSNAKEPLEQTAETASDGSYTLSGLLAGDYIVYARKPAYALQVYQNVKDRSLAKLVTVASDKQPSGIDFALSKIGTIFGTVTAKADGKPVAGAVVTAYGVAGFGSRQVTTDDRGQYSITELPTADFLVTAQARGFALSFYQNTTDKAQAKQVRVLSDAHTTGIDFALEAMAAISGTITGPDGPISGATVTLSRQTDVKTPLPTDSVRPMPVPVYQPGLAVRTDAKGLYKFENIEAGTYIVRADAAGFIGEYYDDVKSPEAAKPIAVAASRNVTGIDLKLTSLATISGKVAASDGKPLRNIRVLAFQRVPANGTVPQPLPAGQAIGSTVKDGAGNVITPPATQPAQPATGRDGVAQPPVAQNPQPATQPQPDQKGGVAVAQPAILVLNFQAEVDTTTGTFRIVGLPAGNYLLQAFAEGCIPAFNGGAETADKASPIAVKEGDKVAGVNFTLARGGAISGFVLGDGDGKPVQGGSVTAQLLGDGGNTGRVQPNGAFRVDGLRDGKYLLKAEASGYVAEFYDGTRQPDKAKLIEIKGGNEVTGLIIGLARLSPVDFNGDGVVDLGDLFMFAQGYGQRKGGTLYNPMMDMTGDGAIGIDDFFVFVSEFSKSGKAGKPVVGADAGRVSFSGAAAPSGLLAVRMTIEASDLTGYIAALGYDRNSLTLIRAERRDGSALAVSQTPDGLVLTDRAGGPTEVTLTFRPSGDVKGDPVTPQMVALVGADGVIRMLDLAGVRAGATPQAFSLGQNAPNPFNPATQIAFDLPQEGPVRLSVYNLLGQRVRTLVDERRGAGHYVVTWDGRDAVGRPAATGVYLYRLTAQGFVQTRKMTLLR